MCVLAVSPAGSMTDSDSDWVELWPIERGSVQLIEFMSEYFLSCRLSFGKLSCIHLQHPRHCKSPRIAPYPTFSVIVPALLGPFKILPLYDWWQSVITTWEIRENSLTLSAYFFSCFPFLCIIHSPFPFTALTKHRQILVSLFVVSEHTQRSQDMTDMLARLLKNKTHINF